MYGFLEQRKILNPVARWDYWNAYLLDQIPVAGQIPVRQWRFQPGKPELCQGFPHFESAGVIVVVLGIEHQFKVWVAATGFPREFKIPRRYAPGVKLDRLKPLLY